MTATGTHKTHFLTYFAAGVAVGALAYKYWPQISGFFRREKSSAGTSAPPQRGRGAERFADVIAEIKKDESAKCCKPSE